VQVGGIHQALELGGANRDGAVLRQRAQGAGAQGEGENEECKMQNGERGTESVFQPLQECSGSFSLSGIKVQSTQMEEDV